MVAAIRSESVAAFVGIRKLLAHKSELFSFLRQRWQMLFQADFEVLLYDLTSTYFESVPPRPANDGLATRVIIGRIACRW